MFFHPEKVPLKEFSILYKVISAYCGSESRNTAQDSTSDKNEVSESMEISVDPLEIMDLEKKPNLWAVENPSVFLKYHCPECDFQDSKLELFTDHALANHENAIVLFSDKIDQAKVKSESNIVIEENCIKCKLLKCICSINEDQTLDKNIELNLKETKEIVSNFINESENENESQTLAQFRDFERNDSIG